MSDRIDEESAERALDIALATIRTLEMDGEDPAIIFSMFAIGGAVCAQMHKLKQVVQGNHGAGIICRAERQRHTTGSPADQLGKVALHTWPVDKGRADQHDLQPRLRG